MTVCNGTLGGLDLVEERLDVFLVVQPPRLHLGPEGLLDCHQRDTLRRLERHVGREALFRLVVLRLALVAVEGEGEPDVDDGRLAYRVMG